MRRAQAGRVFVHESKCGWSRHYRMAMTVQLVACRDGVLAPEREDSTCASAQSDFDRAMVLAARDPAGRQDPPRAADQWPPTGGAHGRQADRRVGASPLVAGGIALGGPASAAGLEPPRAVSPG